METWQNLKVGDRCIVFDADSWMRTGDIGDNAQFYMEAEIINERPAPATYHTPVIDVKFNDGRISKGHFKNGIRPITNKIIL